MGQDKILKTSNDWYKEIFPNKEIIIYDPDGWDRTNWDYSWFEELISSNEFLSRVFESTCMGDINSSEVYKKILDAYKEI